MLTKRELIALKVEGTYNTDSVPAAATDALLVSNVQASNEGARMVERSNIRASLGSEKPIFAGTLKKITFDAEVKGSGTAGTAPEIGSALRACGFGETVVASTSVSYSPVSASIESASIYYWQDGALRKITGARGTVSISAEAGGIGKASFEFIGHDAGIADVALPSASYDATVPVPLIGANFDVGGYAAIISAVSFDVANGLVTPSDISSDDGYGQVFISERKPSGSIDPEMSLPGTKDFEIDWKAGTELTLTTGDIGSVAGNKWSLTANIAYTEISEGERDGIRTNELSFVAVEVTTDDEVSILFT